MSIKTYKCDICDSLFDHPLVRGFDYNFLRCPKCYSPYYERFDTISDVVPTQINRKEIDLFVKGYIVGYESGCNDKETIMEAENYRKLAECY